MKPSPTINVFGGETSIIGKPLWEVREKYKGFTIRIARAGDITFIHTMEARGDRLNVELEGPLLEFEKEEFQVGNYSFYKDKRLIWGEDGIVVAAYWG